MSAADPPRPPWPSEDDCIAEVLRCFDAPSGLAVGPGHDCAAVALGDTQAVITSDVLVDGVHFRLDEDGAEAAGAKALLVNLSDLAAAAAVPLAFEVGVVLPRRTSRETVTGLARGLARVAARYRCPCAGGDTNVADGPLVLAVTALGRPGPAGVLTRAGAREGDVLSVTGPLGGSRAGRHLAFEPRLEEARQLAALGVPHAMMDLSDGLSRDLPRLCRASGVGASIDARLVPVHPDVATCADGRSDLEHALDDGEDFELLVAHASLTEEVRRALDAARVPLLPVGRVRAASEGIRLVTDTGTADLRPRGYDHFAASGGSS